MPPIAYVGRFIFNLRKHVIYKFVQIQFPYVQVCVRKYSLVLNTESHIMEWFPQNVLNGDKPFALLILNQPLEKENKQFVEQYWNLAAVRVAVDGGVLRLKALSSNLVPDILCGDFDSVGPEDIEFYRKKNVKVIHTPDQSETDFTKATKLTLDYITSQNLKVSYIIAVAKCNDRLDHLFGNLNTLYYAKQWTSLPLFILGNGTLTWLLSVGSHKIHVHENFRKSNVGIIPLGNECTDITTTGMKWNLLTRMMITLY